MLNEMTKKRLILTVSIALVFLILILGSTEGKSLVGKAFADFSSEQKQVYWKCIKSDCQELLKAKQYPVYRVCALNCSDYAGKFTSEQNWCEDSDGLNYTQKGVVKSNLYPSGKEDYCYTFPNNKTYLMEGKCKDNKYSYMQKNCGEMGEWECDIKKGACDIIEPPVINAYLIYWGNHYSIAEIEQKTESLQKLIDCTWSLIIVTSGRSFFILIKIFLFASLTSSINPNFSINELNLTAEKVL